MAADLLQTDFAEVWKGGETSTAVKAGSLVCYGATQELGMIAAEVGKGVYITQSAACRAAQRSERSAAKRVWRLKRMINT